MTSTKAKILDKYKCTDDQTLQRIIIIGVGCVAVKKKKEEKKKGC